MAEVSEAIEEDKCQQDKNTPKVQENGFKVVYTTTTLQLFS